MNQITKRAIAIRINADPIVSRADMKYYLFISVEVELIKPSIMEIRMLSTLTNIRFMVRFWLQICF
jgi:hypothetical protein